MIEVEGRKLDKNDLLHELIDEAYLKKYDQKENIPYALGITDSEYADYTMEFLVR